jgi:hypothetical protein
LAANFTASEHHAGQWPLHSEGTESVPLQHCYNQVLHHTTLYLTANLGLLAALAAVLFDRWQQRLGCSAPIDTHQRLIIWHVSAAYNGEAPLKDAPHAGDQECSFSACLQPCNHYPVTGKAGPACKRLNAALQHNLLVSHSSGRHSRLLLTRHIVTEAAAVKTDSS